MNYARMSRYLSNVLSFSFFVKTITKLSIEHGVKLEKKLISRRDSRSQDSAGFGFFTTLESLNKKDGDPRTTPSKT